MAIGLADFTEGPWFPEMAQDENWQAWMYSFHLFLGRRVAELLRTVGMCALLVLVSEFNALNFHPWLYVATGSLWSVSLPLQRLWRETVEQYFVTGQYQPDWRQLRHWRRWVPAVAGIVPFALAWPVTILGVYAYKHERSQR